MKKKSKVLNVVISVVSVVLIVAVIGMLVTLTGKKDGGGLEHGTAKFVVQLDGADCASNDTITVYGEKEISIQCLSRTSSLLGNTESLEPNVKIIVWSYVVSPEEDFDAVINGELYGYSSVGDLTAAFAIRQEVDKIFFGLNKNMLDILRRIFNTENVELPEKDFSLEPYFLLTIESEDGQNNVQIKIKANVNVQIESISLDKGGYVI